MNWNISSCASWCDRGNDGGVVIDDWNRVKELTITDVVYTGTVAVDVALVTVVGTVVTAVVEIVCTDVLVIGTTVVCV